MAQILRHLLLATALLFVAALALLQLSDVVMCGGLFKTCPGTPQWRFAEWVGEHQIVALCVVGAYAIALLTLFRREIPEAVAGSVKQHFFARALAYISLIYVLLVLATHFPRVASLLTWSS